MFFSSSDTISSPNRFCCGTAGDELLSREAAKAVVEELSSGTILDETKVQVLYRILTNFTAEMNKEVDSKDAFKKRAHQKKSYALLVPIVEAGLESATRLANADETQAWLDPLWGEVADVIAHLLTPVRSASNGLYMARSASLLDMLKSVTSHVPPRENGNICKLLSSGVESSIEVAQSQTAIGNDESMSSEVSRKAKTRSEEALKVFESCFDGLCKLEPQSPNLQTLVKSLLEKVSVLSDSVEVPTEDDRELQVNVAIVVCKVVSRNSDMERLTISIFSLLSKLISVDNELLRIEAGNILGRVDVGQVLEEATRRCELAERRAEEAEEHIQELVDEIDDLRDENESLHQQILVYSTSSALT